MENFLLLWVGRSAETYLWLKLCHGTFQPESSWYFFLQGNKIPLKDRAVIYISTEGPEHKEVYTLSFTLMCEREAAPVKFTMNSHNTALYNICVTSDSEHEALKTTHTEISWPLAEQLDIMTITECRPLRSGFYLSHSHNCLGLRLSVCVCVCVAGDHTAKYNFSHRTQVDDLQGKLHRLPVVPVTVRSNLNLAGRVTLDPRSQSQ